MNAVGGVGYSPEKVPEAQEKKLWEMKDEEAVDTPATKRVRSKSWHDIFAYGKNEQWLIDSKELKCDPEPFAKGSFGELYRTRWRGTRICLKKLKNLGGGDEGESGGKAAAVEETGSAALVEMLNEISVLSTIRHPNVVMFLGASVAIGDKPRSGRPGAAAMAGADDQEDSDGEALPQPMILMELMLGGTMAEELSENGKMGLPRMVDQALDVYVLYFLRPCISRHALHSNNAKKYNSPVGDFGLSKVTVEARKPYKMTGGTGSFRYMAPEVLFHQAYDDSVDVYSFGVIMYYMAGGKLPFVGHNRKELHDAHVRGSRPSLRWINSSCNDLGTLISECWAVKAENRPTFEQCITRLEKIRDSLTFLQKASSFLQTGRFY